MAGVRATRAFIPHMRKAGWGRVVLFSSEDAVQPYIEELPYAAAKAGVLNLAKGLSKAYGPDGVLVNAVGPAFIATPMTDAQMEKKAKEKGVSLDEAIQLTLDEERPGIVAKRRGYVPLLGTRQLHHRRVPPGRRRLRNDHGGLRFCHRSADRSVPVSAPNSRFRDACSPQ
jgi:NAD(P)-dependent dehydrogenase (short-subunit alcohol dehydrogenase family)